MESYAQVAARNSDQTAAEASAPDPQTIIPNESRVFDVASFSTGDDITSSTSSAPGGVHVIPRSELSEINTSDEQVISEPGPSMTVKHVEDDTGEHPAANGLKEKLKRHKKFSTKDKEIAVYGSFGTLNLLMLGGLGYWSWKRYTGGEVAWKVIGIAAGAYVGVVGLEWLGVRAYSAWRQKKEKSS